MKSYNSQYKILFCLSWIILYLIFPVWISKHSIFTNRFPDISYPIARSLVILGFIMYFSVSAYLMNILFNSLTIEKPFIIKINDWFKHIKNNLWLVIVCYLSVVLHIHTFSYVTILGELPFLRQTYWIYDILNKYWYKLFNFPLQYFFWLLLFLTFLIIKQKKMINFIINYTGKMFSQYKSSNMMKFLLILFMFYFFSAYSNIFPYHNYYESLQLIRYPPLSSFLYLIIYFAFGTSHLGPRILQFIFYILGAIYLYRTILLFNKKETALLGAAIYLFSPIMFSFASQAALASGAIFFIILISFYFLRFLKDEDNRDLILTAFFIGTGFMYRGEMLIMFIVCFTYLLLSSIKKQDWSSILHFKILLLPLVLILPWMKIGHPIRLYGLI